MIGFAMFLAGFGFLLQIIGVIGSLSPTLGIAIICILLFLAWCLVGALVLEAVNCLTETKFPASLMLSSIWPVMLAITLLGCFLIWLDRTMFS